MLTNKKVYDLIISSPITGPAVSQTTGWGHKGQIHLTCIMSEPKGMQVSSWVVLWKASFA
jgi:hypothetical protein